MISGSRLLLTSVLLIGLGAFLFALPTWSQSNVQGHWQTLPYTMPVNPVHGVLMPTGKVLIVPDSGSVPANTNFQAILWDPQVGNVSIPVGQSVVYAGSGSDAGGSINSYSWNFEDGTPRTSDLANPGSVTDSTPGTHVTTLTVTDNQEVTDPHPPTRAITVTSPADFASSASQSLQPIAQAGTSPDFTLGVSPSAEVVDQGGTTPYTTRLSVINGFNGAATLSVSGLPAGARASFVPPSITGPGSSTLTVSTGASTPPGSYSLTVKGTSGTLTHTATTTLIVTQSAGSATINFGSGFTNAGLQFNGHTKLDGTRLQLTDTTSKNEVASAFSTTPVNVNSFTTAFSFQLTNPAADGFTFTIQNAGITAIGSPGGGLGYGKISTSTAAIAKSAAVKLDLFNNNGEGINSTGLYTNGVAPTVPATTLANGVNLHSGDVFLVQMDYDGMTLTVTITDATTPGHTFTTSFPIDIPATVGGNTAFVGFTAGTGGETTTQEILNWTYNVTSGFSLTLMEPGRGGSSLPATGAVAQGARTDYRAIVTPTNGFTGTVALSLSGVPAGINPFFTTGSTITGSDFAVIAIDPIPANFPPGFYTFTVTGVSGSISHSTTAALAIGKAAGGGIDLGSGFSAEGLQFNGHSKLDGTRLQLTDSTSANQASSVFWKTPMNVQSFSTTFTFQLTNPNADGFTFTIQNYDVTALGSSGAGLGYGKFSSLTAFIPLSAAVKFDLFSNSGEGPNSTGLYTSLRGAEFGPQPTVPAIPLSGGINLHSGDIFQVQMRYDGATLTMTITDLTVPANTFTTSFPISIPNTMGSNFAFVGFTAATGGQTATQEILNWTYSTP
jgi:hypothetical protein